jgi:ferric-dicitrate binding protein FerR (iron transport regulator)
METPDLENLYLKKINGTLLPEEAHYLEQRLNKNPDEKKDFESFLQLWQSSGRLPVHDSLTRDDRWEKLQQRLDGDISHQPRWNLNVLLRYAASIALVIVAIGTYLFFGSPDRIRIETGFGEIKTITLPDNSTVKLNAGTLVEYDRASWDEERLIQLDGEAYFDVQKNGASFTVESNQTVVKVLGTTFNVRTRHETTEVACLTGKVSFSTKAAGAKIVILTPGLGANVLGESLSEAYPVENDNAVSWVAGNLSFSNTPLKEVFQEFERHFNASIVIKKDVGELTFTGKFSKPRLHSALETVCLSAGLRYTINKHSIVIE